MTIITKEFRIDKNFNVDTLNSFLEGVERSGGRILNQFAVQIDNGQSTNYYITYEDAVPPTVIRTSPVDTQAGVPAGSDIVIIFSEDVVLGTAPFEILKDGSPVTGFTWIENNGRVDISDAIDADIGAYTVRVKKDEVEDLNGNPMDLDFTFSFTSSLDTLSGAFIADRINVSSAVINDVNVAPDVIAQRHTHTNYQRSAGNRMSLVGATGVYADDFFTDFSVDPGAPYSPTSTTTRVDVSEMRMLSDQLGNGATGVFYSDTIPAAAATGMLLEFDADIPTGGSITHEIIKDGETAGFTTLSPDTFTAIPALTTSFQVRTQLINPGTGGYPTVYNQEVYFF